jgi:hypothetical protein
MDAWTDKIIASRDNIFGNNDDIVLAEYAHQGELAVNQSYTIRENLRLPIGFSGQYYLGVETDAEGIVFENNLTDNNLYQLNQVIDIAPIPYADLIINDLQVEETGSK